MIPLEQVLALSAILFTIGVVGAITRRNLIVILMSIELMLNGTNLALVGFSRQWAQPDGQIFVLMVIVVAAAEVAVGLGIVISLFRNRETVNVEDVSLLKWSPRPRRCAGSCCRRYWRRCCTACCWAWCAARSSGAS